MPGFRFLGLVAGLIGMAACTFTPGAPEASVDVGQDAGTPDGRDAVVVSDAGSPLDGGDIADVGNIEDTGIDAGQDAGPEPLEFSYPPSNFDPAPLAREGNVVIDCAAVISTDPGTDPFDMWCPDADRPAIATSSTGLAIVLAMRSLLVTETGSIEIQGERPLTIAVFGDAVLAGPVRLNAQITASTVENGCPPTGVGGTGTEADGAGGGGGGAFSGTGGPGGTSNGGGGGGGGASVPAGLEPLRTGCPGGTGGSDGVALGGPGGAGGGALQLSAAGELALSSVIAANGDGGGGGQFDAGGGGGGSGGGILLEGRDVTLQNGAWITANGGGGGGGGSNNGLGDSGEPGREASRLRADGGNGTNASNDGGPGAAGAEINGDPGDDPNTDTGGGGGGGGAGYIHINAINCNASGSAEFSPAPAGNCT